MAPLSRSSWLHWARTYLCLFRIVVVSTCVGLAAYAWLAGIPWLLGASVCIGLGEMIECSYYLAVLGWGQRSGRLPLPVGEALSRGEGGIGLS